MPADMFSLSLATLKPALLFLHLIGLALGLGSASLLDLLLLRTLRRRRILPAEVAFIRFASAVVTAGLALLWLSGLGLLACYSAFDLPALQNPKLWVKILIVALLSLNGLAIHAFLLPLVRRQAGRDLFDGVSAAKSSLLLVAGAVSVTSWYVPMFLGVAKPLNFVVPALALLAAYGALLAAAMLAALLFGRLRARSRAAGVAAPGQIIRLSRQAAERNPGRNAPPARMQPRL